jgi:hypothetical protein
MKKMEGGAGQTVSKHAKLTPAPPKIRNCSLFGATTDSKIRQIGELGHYDRRKTTPMPYSMGSDDVLPKTRLYA